jgi:O-antigen/teichoic acid export membrane protein
MLRTRRIKPSGRGLEETLAPRLKNHLLWTVLLTIAAAFGNKASETYLLSTFVGPAEVGFFAIAASLTRGGVELLSAGLNTVLMPLMGHGFGAGGTARVNAILSDAVRYFSFAGLLLAGVGFMWADVAIALMYGAQYQAATPVFRVMAVVAGITLSQGAFGALLSTTDNQRIRAYVAVLSVGLSIIAAVLLVPRFGLDGAVVAHAVSSAVIFLLIGVGIVKVFSVSLPWRELARLCLAAVIASAVAAGCFWIDAGLVMQFVGGLLYALVFIASTFAFKAWKEEDVAQLMPLADRFPKLLGRVLPALSNWMRR